VEVRDDEDDPHRHHEDDENRHPNSASLISEQDSGSCITYQDPWFFTSEMHPSECHQRRDAEPFPIQRRMVKDTQTW
jgi:hypothetical protein